MERESSKEIALKHPRAIHWKPPDAASIETLNRKRSQNNGLTACPDLISVKSPPDGYCNCYITLVLGVGEAV